MGSPERSSRGYSKRDIEDGSDLKSDRLGDDEERESGDKKKHGSSKSRKSGHVEDAEAFEGSGRRRSSGGDRYEGRKRLGGSGRGDSDEDDYSARKESRSKQVKKQREVSSLDKLSSWYQDGDLENKRSGDRSGGKGSVWDESDRRKTLSKVSEDEIYHGGSKSKEEWSYDVERKESSRERATDVGRNQRRRWDESDDVTKAEEKHHEKADGRSTKGTDSKHDNSREKSSSGRNDYGESKSRVFDSSDDKSLKTNSRDDTKDSPIAREDRSGREINEKPRNHGDEDEDESAWMRDKRTREGGRSNRSRTPERSGRPRQESQFFDDRSVDIKRKDAECGDRSKARDENWIDRNRDWDSSRDGWNRRTADNDKELNDGDIFYDRSKDREPRHGRERNDHDRSHGRNRGEAVKTSSNFGISNENYDVIEIQTKPLDYGRTDAKAVTEEWAYTQEKMVRRHDGYSTEDFKEKTVENDISVPGRWKDDNEYPGSKGRGQRGSMYGRGGDGSQHSNTGSQPSYGNQEPGSFNRGSQQGIKGSRVGRAGRGRPTGRDNQQVTLPLLPVMGSPFGPLGIPPPGPIQPLPPNMLSAPGPPISPGVFIPSFSPPVVWPGARGVEMNMLGIPSSLPPIPLGPGPRFPPSMGTALSIYFNIF